MPKTFNTKDATEAERFHNTVKAIPMSLHDLPQTIETRTIEDLITYFFRVYQLEEDEVRQVLREAGYIRFDPRNWKVYTAIVARHVWEKKYENSWPEKCPICDGQVQRDPTNDFRFGAKLGWKCTDDKSHFYKYRVDELKTKLAKKKERIKNGANI